MSVFSLIFVFIAFCYICGSTKATTKDDDLLQAIHLANSPNISPKPYMPIQEQQKQQQYAQKLQEPQQPNKRSSTMTLRIRQKRSQNDLSTMGIYFRKIPTFGHNLALLNIMHTLRKQPSNIELEHLRSRLSHSTLADLQLLNEIYNNNEFTALNDDEVDNVNVNDGATTIGTNTGNGGLGKFADVGGVVDVGVPVIASNDMLANDIENLSEPWKFVARVSKKSSALYKPRLGKRTQQQQRQQQQ